MAVTTPNNLPSPNGGSLFDYSAHMGALAQATQDALKYRANLFTGTGSERDGALNDLAEGAFWSDTDGNKLLHQKRNGIWWPEMQYQNIHVITPNFAVNPNALAITNFGRVAHLSCHFYQTATYDWGAQSTIQLASFDDKWAPPPGGMTMTFPMDPGIDNDGRTSPWSRKDLLVARRIDSLPVFQSRVMIYSENALRNTYTSADKRAGISFSVSWPLPY